MKKVYIWGAGPGLNDVWESLDLDGIMVLGIIDNNKQLNGNTINGCTVFSPEQIEKEVDYFVIALRYNFLAVQEQIIALGYEETQIIRYFDIWEFKNIQQVDFINYTLRTFHLFQSMNREFAIRLENFEYELADKVKKGYYEFPIIKEREIALNRIIEEYVSMCRFGDGEFEVLFGRKRPDFQYPNEKLAKRLSEIINNTDEKIITCIADNYGSLEKYTDDAANAIRSYLTPSVRREHLEVIDKQKVYYDAYVSRPYILYKDKSEAEKLFSLWKKVWNNREIVLVEGEYTRSGFGNDLFNNAQNIQRVLCPAENSWDKYSDILDFVLQNVKPNKLILIALGPTATVLAYDLAQEGYQAIDMGHLDNEYEWYLRNVEKRVNIEYKYVHEYGKEGMKVQPINDERYLSQIISRI